MRSARPRLSHILFRLPEHPAERQLAGRPEGEGGPGGSRRLTAKEEFAKVAAEAFEDESTKTTGGSCWFQRGSINPEWEQIVFSMEKGDVRGPVTGPQGPPRVPGLRRQTVRAETIWQI